MPVTVTFSSALQPFKLPANIGSRETETESIKIAESSELVLRLAARCATVNSVAGFYGSVHSLSVFPFSMASLHTRSRSLHVRCDGAELHLRAVCGVIVDAVVAATNIAAIKA